MSKSYKPSDEATSMIYAAGIIGSLNFAFIFFIMGKATVIPFIVAGAFIAAYSFNEILSHYKQKKAYILSAYHRSNHGINEYIEALKDEDGRLEQEYRSTMEYLSGMVPNRSEKIRATRKYYSRMIEHNNRILCKI